MSKISDYYLDQLEEEYYQNQEARSKCESSYMEQMNAKVHQSTQRTSTVRSITSNG